MAMAAGASTVEVPASGGNGGTATSCGRPSCSEDGQSRFNRNVAPTKAATTMTMTENDDAKIHCAMQPRHTRA